MLQSYKTVGVSYPDSSTSSAFPSFTFMSPIATFTLRQCQQLYLSDFAEANVIRTRRHEVPERMHARVHSLLP